MIFTLGHSLFPSEKKPFPGIFLTAPCMQLQIFLEKVTILLGMEGQLFSSLGSHLMFNGGKELDNDAL